MIFATLKTVEVTDFGVPLCYECVTEFSLCMAHKTFMYGPLKEWGINIKIF